MGKLDGKVALITGGASGIGYACAERYLEEGAVITLSDIGAERLSSAAAELRKGTNAQVSTFEADVRSESDLDALMSHTNAEYGRIDTVLAAAGVASASPETFGSTLLTKTLEEWNEVLAINLTGVMLTNRLAARHMMQTGGGSIVNISSSAARIALPGAVDYCVSKAGVSMLTHGFALEMLEHNIRVNAIGPGYVDTPMTQSEDPEEGREHMEAMTPMGRIADPKEIAATALYLASEESSYTTGATLYPNGGMYIA